MLTEARPNHPEFCIPIITIPATISNNVPGTDFSLGSDTSLNEIADVCIYVRTVFYVYPFNTHCCHVCTATKHPVPDRVKQSFIIFDILAL